MLGQNSIKIHCILNFCFEYYGVLFFWMNVASSVYGRWTWMAMVSFFSVCLLNITHSSCSYHQDAIFRTDHASRWTSAAYICIIAVGGCEPVLGVNLCWCEPVFALSMSVVINVEHFCQLSMWMQCSTICFWMSKAMRPVKMQCSTFCWVWTCECLLNCWCVSFRMPKGGASVFESQKACVSACGRGLCSIKWKHHVILYAFPFLHPCSFSSAYCRSLCTLLHHPTTCHRDFLNGAS